MQAVCPWWGLLPGFFLPGDAAWVCGAVQTNQLPQPSWVTTQCFQLLAGLRRAVCWARGCYTAFLYISAGCFTNKTARGRAEGDGPSFTGKVALSKTCGF